MTREEVIKGLTSLVEVRRKYVSMQTMKDEIECLDMAIKELEQEPCGKDVNVPATDAINRQAVLDGLASIAKAKAKSDAQKSLMGRVMFFTEQLPPVTPQPKIGHWIKTKEQDDAEPLILWKCSECLTVQRLKTNYCPNCGARMAESEVSDATCN